VKILIVEDERELAAGIADYLSDAGCLCEFAGTFRLALDKIGTHDYDCILLDIMLPDGNGMHILEELKRRDGREGVIVISAKDAVDDKIRGLQIGADDYLTKPFHLAELAARLYAVIRRKQFGNATNTVRHNEILIDLPGKTVTVHAEPVALTKKEFDLLLYFIGNRNKVISRSTLAEHLSGDFADMLDNHDFVYAHIKNLKRKLRQANCGDYLKTIYGTGYKWETGYWPLADSF